MDEPTNGLDPGGIGDIRALIHKLSEEGLRILLSSHLLVEVEQLCDRVAEIGRGRLVAEGSLDRVTQGTGGRSRLTYRSSSATPKGHYSCSNTRPAYRCLAPLPNRKDSAALRGARRYGSLSDREA